MREKTGGRAEYRSAIRSRRMIREAYTVLLKEKDLSKITVTDIVNRADINRATFYAHYPDVRGVTEEIENEIIAKMLEVLKEFEFTNFFRNPTPLLLQDTWKKMRSFTVSLSRPTAPRCSWKS